MADARVCTSLKVHTDYCSACYAYDEIAHERALIVWRGEMTFLTTLLLWCLAIATDIPLTFAEGCPHAWDSVSASSIVLRTTLNTAYKLFHGNMNLPLEEFSMRQHCTSCLGVNSRSVSPDPNSHEGKLHLQCEWSGRGTDCHPPPRKRHRSMRSRSGWTIRNVCFQKIPFCETAYSSA